MLYFDALRLALLAVVIGYAAYSDHKTGEVRNRVWLYAPVGLALTGVSLLLSPELLYLSLVSFTATGVFSFVLFYLGGWGGADTKAFLTIGASFPVALYSVTHIIFIYPLSVALVASILALTIGRVYGKRELRFIPYVFVGLFIAFLL